MSVQPLPSKMADLTPGQLHSLMDYTQAVNERQRHIEDQIGMAHQKLSTPGQVLRSSGFKEAYRVITETPGRHKRGEHKANGKLAVALEQFGYRPVNAEYDVGDTPDADET